jgi:hypothetical protein
MGFKAITEVRVTDSDVSVALRAMTNSGGWIASLVRTAITSPPAKRR